MSVFGKTSKRPALDMPKAEQILKEIFEACGREPNPTPLEVLASYQNYRQERYALQKSILGAVFVLFLLLPLLFFRPAFSLFLNPIAEPGRPVYQVQVTTCFPISMITAKIDGHPIAVYETGSHTYSIEPTRNGMMTVTVTLINRQSVEQNIWVSKVDRTAPSLLSNRQGDGQLCLYLMDEDSGIYYEGIYALNPEEERIEPLFYDPETGRVEFPFPTATIEVYIPDRAGNLLQLIVSVPSNSSE